jgi:hypothetical protein
MSWKCLCDTVNDDSWARCVGCDGEFRDDYKAISIDKQSVITSENTIFRPNKIEPTYGFNIRRRMAGLLFGISIPLLVFMVILKFTDRWEELDIRFLKYLLYGIVIFGLSGFFLGDKYYNHIIKFWNMVKNHD